MPNPFVKDSPQKNMNMSLENALKAFQDIRAMGTNPQQVEQLLLAKYPNLRSLAEEVEKSGHSLLDFAAQKYMQKNINIGPTIQRMLDMTKNNRY